MRFCQHERFSNLFLVCQACLQVSALADIECKTEIKMDIQVVYRIDSRHAAIAAHRREIQQERIRAEEKTECRRMDIQHCAESGTEVGYAVACRHADPIERGKIQ